MPQPSQIVYLLLAGIFALPFPSGAPWDKPAEQWTLADAYKILDDSPWSASRVTIDTRYTQRHTDYLTGVVSNSPSNVQNTANIRGIEISRAAVTPAYLVKWWSSKTIRLAEWKSQQLKADAGGRPVAPPIGESPDYVVAIEGDEPLRILRDAREDLHDTVFLELGNGFTLDLATVQFVDGPEALPVRTEFHFPRQLDGMPGIDPGSERIVFHCRATAKKEAAGRENAIAIRVDFHPKDMKARGQPDL
jgi:hypothetical protein